MPLLKKAQYLAMQAGELALARKAGSNIYARAY